MRLIRDVLRLKYESGLSERAISATLGISKGAIGSYLSRARAAKLSWPLPAELSEAALERLLFPGPRADAEGNRPVPDWAEVERELRRRGVTRALLWQEYRARHPEGFGYSWFCETYDVWKRQLSPTMRQSHVAGVAGHRREAVRRHPDLRSRPGLIGSPAGSLPGEDDGPSRE